MKTRLIFFITLLITPSLFAKDLILSLGETHRMTLKGLSRIWIQDGQILQAEAAGKQILLKPRKEGQTTLRLGDESYKVQVLHPEKKDTFRTLQESLQKIVGLSPEVTEGELTIGGHLYRFEDWLRLAETIKTTSVTYKFRAKMSEALQKDAQKYFSGLLEKAKIPPQSIIFEPEPEIRVSGPDLFLKKYIRLLRPFGIQVIKDEQSLEIAPTIKVKITVAEVSRDFTRKYGIAWPEAYKTKLLGDGGTLFEDLELDLQALEINGKGKILASPNIICRSGNEAEFLAGGEFPIKVMNYKVHDIVWKRYGILLKVKPKADAAGRMSISIETEVSRVDESRKVDDVPAILTNRVSSHFDLTGPQTIALSGLLKSEDSKQSQGLIGLSDIPVLGALFGSKNFRENKTELVIFVRPTILHGNEDPETNEHLTDAGGDL